MGDNNSVITQESKHIPFFLLVYDTVKKRRKCQHLQPEHGNYYGSSSSSLFTFVKSTEGHTPWNIEIVMIIIQYQL